VDRLAKDPFGFFEFAPAERLDLDLLDRVLHAARQEAGSVDVVLLPESAVEKSEIDDLETVLDAHGVVYLQAGVREPAHSSERFPNNWVHIGVNPRLEKGGPLPSGERQPWFHIHQNKHHPWSLDESQVDQYHLGSALHPHIRWWEAMDVPRKAIQIVEVAELVMVSLVCEDLAQNDEIAQLIRSVGPTAVIVGLLDGPQIASRWSARYASVLADDPGSSVLTLSSFGMVERSRPDGREASRVIALWKDPTTGIREIPLEPGAHGVLLTVSFDRATRYAADRRWPVDNSTFASGVAVHQVHAADAGSPAQPVPPTAATMTLLETEELTILTAWAEGVSEAAAYAPDRVGELLAQARTGSAWRAELGLPDLSGRLADAIESLARVVGVVAAPAGTSLFNALITAADEDDLDENTLDGLVRHVLLSMLEERQTRQSTGPSAGR
jgi:hypothetical protein